MKIKLQEFKLALLKALATNLELLRRNEEENFVFTGYSSNRKRVSYKVDYRAGTCTAAKSINELNQWSDQFNIIKSEKYTEGEQQHIRCLLRTIKSNNDGYDLWSLINSQVKTMPGWWNIFSNLRNLRFLTPALESILEQYRPEELKKENDEWTKKLLEELKNQIQKLLSTIEELKQHCKQLELKNSLQSESLPLVQQQTEEILAAKNKILLELEQVRSANKVLLEQNSSFKDRISKVSQANNKLIRTNTDLERENEELRQQLMEAIEKIKETSQQVTSAISAVNSKERTPNSPSKLTAYSEDFSLNEFNEQYKRLCRKPGSVRNQSIWNRSNNDSNPGSDRGNTKSQSPSSKPQ
ncbi:MULTISPECIES: hypothetical protein [unclassified Legionella]|uniref:hypothetical protein n=1 Tax=unclassified Legionella TaxID=2622702 RepID=UPI0010541F8C|nr:MULTISPECIES: hypothetical protein [unclassified Legionella]MDI9818335.1 hypothetical protein [Legionella sp. PL877]